MSITEHVDAGQSFTCADCDREFIAVRSAAEAAAEYEQTFNDIEKAESTAIVCDDCWNARRPLWERMEGAIDAD